ncbi:MAG: hypothetical protein WC828_03630 [Thermoleophilia bacterium]
MSRKRIALLLLLGVVIATTMVLALNVSAQAQGYGGGVTGGAATTGAEVILFGVAGMGLIGAGYFLTRKAKA